MLLTAKEICNKMTGTTREFHSILTAPFLKITSSIEKSVPQGGEGGGGGSYPDFSLFDAGRGRSWLEIILTYPNPLKYFLKELTDGLVRLIFFLSF